MATHTFINYKALYQKDFKSVVKNDAMNDAMTPQIVFELIVGYFKWCEENPIEAPETASFQGTVYQGKAAKLRPFTQNGLCLFIGVNQKTWRQWRKNGSPELQELVAWADSIIYEQKYGGAISGIFNAHFVMKDLNMDVSTVKQIGDPDQPVSHHHTGNGASITIDESAVDKLLSKL